jgi:Ala-tRNA(Pro) deacylase
MWIHKMLQLRGVPFEERHHRRAYTAQEVARREHFSGHKVAKVVVAMADGRPVKLVLPASRQVSLEQVRDILKTRHVRLASEEEMAQTFPDCEVGALPPLEHYDGVEVIMDRALETDNDILFQAGTHTDAVRVPFEDWFRAFQPRVESFSRPAETPWPW